MTRAESASVLAFLRHDAEILLTRSNRENSTGEGYWVGVSIPLDAPVQSASDVRERLDHQGHLREATLVRIGEPVVPSSDNDRTVYPALFDCVSREIDLPNAAVEHEWVPPTAIHRRETIPGLWAAYDRVRPTVASVRDDGEHGSGYISIRAMEVLRDAAGAVRRDDTGTETAWGGVTETAEELLDARPSMAAVVNRVNRIVSRSAEDRTAATVERVAIEEIAAALQSDRRAANEAAPLVADATVLTLSRSGTLLPTLTDGPDRVVVAESRPGREGIGVAERIAEAGVNTVLCADSAVAHVLATEPIDAVLVGADTVLRDGTIINKIGTRGAAVAATAEDVPVYAVTARDKISPAALPTLETGPGADVYDGDRSIDVVNPTFDVTPPRYITEFVTDDGRLHPDDVFKVAADHAALASWRHDSS